ncbi:RNA-binding S4 domain-containing protein [Gulosibacter sp. ACHW.36C]|uniref:RNA-binding S4 domain-containing protein n=1 Tax=Gulosibacter sediminis TaxID=1729695 RepID=A0ABY4N0J0_9MICO|nr:RNA-binding S4 domain-containing protein [Gulosibacter sediminis]UQN15146.1 RNA-binding S4 domain-containing protein [Gulosibacter sediminis]
MSSSDPIDDVQIEGDMIRLGQFLKFSGLLDTGGDAKEVIGEGHVRVNGEGETRRGRQLHDGDVVELGGHGVRVRAGA